MHGSLHTLSRPGGWLIVTAHEQVPADLKLLHARLAPAARNAINAIIAHWLLLSRSVRGTLLLYMHNNQLLQSFDDMAIFASGPCKI